MGRFAGLNLLNRTNKKYMYVCIYIHIYNHIIYNIYIIYIFCLPASTSALPKALMLAGRQNSDLTSVTCLDLNLSSGHSHVTWASNRLLESQFPYL